jgi:hypothetical protein
VRVDALDTGFSAPAAPLAGDATRVRAKGALTEPPPAPVEPDDAPPLDGPGQRTVVAPTVFAHDDDDDEGATRALTRAGDLFAAELALAAHLAPTAPAAASVAPRRASLAPPRAEPSAPVEEVSLTEQIAPGDLLAVRATLAPRPEDDPTAPVDLPAALVAPAAAPVAPAARPAPPAPPPPPRHAFAPAPPRAEVIAGVVLAVSLLAVALAWAIR